MKDKKFMLFLVGVFAVVGFFFYSFNSASVDTAPAAGTGAAVQQQAAGTVGTNQGDFAPDFTLSAVDGGTISLSDFKGEKPVLLYFGATWCPNCRRDLSAVQSIYDEYRDEVEFIAVGMDTRESARTLSSYQHNMGLQSLTFATGSGKLNQEYNARYTTSKFGINRDGTIAFSRVGAVSEADWRQMFEALAS